MKKNNRKINTTPSDRPPDYVTVIRSGNTILTLNGYCAPNVKLTAEDRLLKLMKAELETAQERNLLVETRTTS